MGTLGDNLLLQWWSQNRCPYAPGMTLWIEADSWSSTVWKNKAPGAEYDLTPYNSSNTGVLDGNAVKADSSHKLDYRAERNILGTGAFTVEACVRPNESAIKNVTYAWLFSQRTQANSDAGQFQCLFNRSGSFNIGAFDGTSAVLTPGGYVRWDLDAQGQVAEHTIFCVVQNDPGNNMIWNGVDDDSHSYSATFSATKKSFSIGNALFNTSFPYLGLIYSFRVWQRALTPAEIAANYAVDRRRFNF